MARSLKEQAFAVIESRSFMAKNGHLKKTPGRYRPIKSVRSLRETSYALGKIATNLGVSRIKQITEAQAKDYLEQRKQNFTSQKSLDLDRKALSLSLGIEIPRLKAISDTVLEGRSYSNTELIHVTESHMMLD